MDVPVIFNVLPPPKFITPVPEACIVAVVIVLVVGAVAITPPVNAVVPPLSVKVPVFEKVVAPAIELELPVNETL